MDGVYLRYIDVPPDIKAALSSYTSTHTNSTLSTISLASLKVSQPDQVNYATFEHNYWKLDGTYRGVTGQSTLIWNDDVSGDNANRVYVDGTTELTLYLNNYGKAQFENYPALTRNWSSYQTAPGVYLIFYGPDFCTSLNIKWYQGSTLLSDKDFYPTSQGFFCENRVELFNKCVITFKTMSSANRFLKVVDLWEGQLVEFYNEDLRNVKIIEEYDPTGDVLPINTMEVEFSHKIDDLNLVFQSKQVMEAYYNDTLYGKFFIDKSSDKYHVTTTDYKGLLDKSIFLGNYYSNATVTSIIQDILAGEDNIKSDIPSPFNSIRLTGPIKKCTKREALAQVLFALCGYADDSRSDTLIMTQSGGEVGPYTIPKNKTFLSDRKDIHESPVTEVRLTVHDYKASANSTELFSATLSAGTYTVEFSDPIVLSTLSVTNATVTKSSAFYVTISVSSTSTVTISAKVYEDNPYVITKTNSIVPAGTPTNIVEYTDKTLVTANGALYPSSILDFLLYCNKFNKKYETKIKATNTIGTLVKIYPDNESAANSGLAIKYEYKLRRNQIGKMTLLVGYDGEY